MSFLTVSILALMNVVSGEGDELVAEGIRAKRIGRVGRGRHRDGLGEDRRTVNRDRMRMGDHRLGLRLGVEILRIRSKKIKQNDSRLTPLPPHSTISSNIIIATGTSKCHRCLPSSIFSTLTFMTPPQPTPISSSQPHIWSCLVHLPYTSPLPSAHNLASVQLPAAAADPWAILVLQHPAMVLLLLYFLIIIFVPHL